MVILPFEIVWSIDFLAGAQLLGIASYMFEPERPLYLCSLSFFHIALPLIIIFLLRRLGYDRRALAAQILLTWIVLPVICLITDPAANINWAFGFGKESQTMIHPLLYLALGMILLPVVVYLPSHLMLQRLFSHR